MIWFVSLKTLYFSVSTNQLIDSSVSLQQALVYTHLWRGSPESCVVFRCEFAKALSNFHCSLTVSTQINLFLLHLFSHSPLLLLLILTLSREFIGNESAKERKTRRFKMHSHSLAKFQCLSLSLPFASYKPIFRAISSWQNKFTWQTKTRNSANMYCFSNRQLTTR